MLKRSLLVFTLSFLLGLSGCGGTTPCTPFPVERNVPAWMLLVGQPEDMFVGPSLDYAGECRGIEGTTITGAHIEIFDPEQQPVVFESSLNSTDTLGVSLRFTPTKEGRYHFFISFEPIGGIQQFELLAVQDRSREPVLQQLPHHCNVLERTRSGAWICGTNVFRGASFLQALPTGRVAVVGDVVWVVSRAQIQRYVDTGTKLELTASLDQQWGVPESLSATESDVVMLYTYRMEISSFDGKALSSKAATQWLPPEGVSPLGEEGPRGVLFRTGDRLAVVQNVQGTPGAFQSCTFQLSGSGFVRTAAPCQLLQGFVVGFEPRALWVAQRDAPTGTLRTLQYLEWEGAEFLPRALLAVPETLALSTPLRLLRSSAVPVLRPNFPLDTLLGRSAVPVYVPGEPLLRLQHMEAELSSPLASPFFFWGNMIDSRFTILGARIRAVAPAP
jgi:hypothetical protein